jgi:hypothetical protein
MEWIDHVANMIIAGGVLFGVYQGWHNGRAIKKVEHATNSLMDARIVVERSDATQIERAAGVAAAAVDRGNAKT